MNIEEIRKQILAEANEEILDPVVRLESNSARALRYAELLYRVKLHRGKVKILVDEKKAELRKRAKFDSSYLLKNNQDVDSFIDTDKEYQNLKNKLNSLDALVELFDDVVYTYQQREATERTIFKYKTGVN
jgi:hypothetical protein